MFNHFFIFVDNTAKCVSTFFVVVRVHFAEQHGPFGHSRPIGRRLSMADPDDTNGQLKLEGWLYIVLIFYTLFNDVAPFYWEFGRGGTILLGIWKRRHHCIGFFREEVPFY